MEERRCGQTRPAVHLSFYQERLTRRVLAKNLRCSCSAYGFDFGTSLTWYYSVGCVAVRRSSQTALLMLKDRSLDLGETLRYARAGRYVFTPTEEVDRQNPRGATNHRHRMGPRGRVAVPVGDLSPGLYDLGEDSVEMTHPAGKHLLARVLVCDSTAYPDATAAYQKVRDLADGWAKFVDLAVTRAFLLSLLAGMGNCTGSSPISKRD